ARAAVPVGTGTLCLGTPIFRVGLHGTDGAGTAAWRLALASPQAPAALILAGSTWSFQAAFRDPVAVGGPTLNFSSSLTLRFGI
ncbi:MAG: hypothetical protein AAGG01_20245, partial [Planctomycetota bacterium]